MYAKKLTQEMKNDVISYFYDEEISYNLPDMKYSGLYFMCVTLQEAYNHHYMLK